jgi:hypothetical protein
MRTATLLVLSVSACSSPDSGSNVPDLAGGGAIDFSTGAGGDLSTSKNDLSTNAGDLSSGAHDLSASTNDLSTTNDLSANANDLSMNGSDLSNASDLSSTNDLSNASDLPRFMPSTVFTVILENTSYSSVVGSANAPYLNSLINSYGLATNYMDSGTHPSLPNYLYMTSGATQYPGIVDCQPTGSCDLIYSFPVDQDNLGHQLTAAGVPWRAYMDSMGAGVTCLLTDASPYATKHNPFVYYTDIQSNTSLCNQVDVDYTTNFATDLAAGTYRYMWITPDLNHDGHDTNLMTADTWCSNNIPAILNSAVFKAGGVLFITWDEGEGFPTADHVPMIVVTPGIKSAGYQSSVAYTHASYLATVEDLFGVPRLGAAVGVANMYEFWQ